MDDDARFKMLLRAPAILRRFFDAFLPEVARFIDFGILELVDREPHAMAGAPTALSGATLCREVL